MYLFLCARNLALGVLVFSFLAVSGLLSSGGQAQAQSYGSDLSGPPQMNATYAARDPRRCTSLASPPNQEQAAVLIQCTMEVGTSIGVRLMQNVSVQLGAPRKFQPETDSRLQEIDAQAPIFTLTGSAMSYFCSSVAFGLYHAGTNCTVTPMPQVNGRCWRTTFGDWKCSLDEPTADSRSGQPGPITY